MISSKANETVVFETGSTLHPVGGLQAEASQVEASQVEVERPGRGRSAGGHR